MKLRNMLSMLALLTLFSMPAFAQEADTLISPEDIVVNVDVATADGMVMMSFPSVDMFTRVVSGELVSLNDPGQSNSPATYAFQVQEPLPDDDPVEDVGVFSKIWTFLTGNWIGFLLFVLAIMDAIAAFIPTSQDWTGFKWLRALIYGVIPNRDKTGGRHPTTPV